MKYIAKKASQRFGQTFGQNSYTSTDNNNKNKNKEGSVSIDKMPSKNKKSKSDVGEYVDYEEID